MSDEPRTAAGTGDVFDPDLLSRCMSCGFCLPSCPTYRMTGEEASSPRGRITLMRAVQDGRLDVTDPTVLAQSQFCLGCRACEPVCPAGVQYGELLEEWRDTAWQGRNRPVLAKLLMLMMSRLGMVGITLAGLVRRAARTRRGTPAAPNLMLGCVERVLYPKVSRAARRADPSLVAPAVQGCCGALHAHNGESGLGRRMARRLGRQLPGTIVTTSGGCSAHLAAELGADRVQEFSAWLAAGHGPDLADLTPIQVDGRRARLGLQDSCHLRNALGVWREPREVLAHLGDYVEVPDAGSCCGAAGSYSVLRPADSREVLAPKVAAIAELDLDYLVVVNPGCYRQMAAGLRGSGTRVVHLAELVARAL
ncbi:(Fe-S)-binding protein [Actinocatenispora rupis]|uniref:Glycolate oxidase iron-sulfur subunit n=1 Tax=Actinocatenispora rupis TaxID=519421 RepID=A0A8J3N9K5_9ACTN|nr:(Fe-S)-binding protein [Actinocatenispora rupis]GID11196.1 glycolate oxidase iron-sulfur subunit [Actinocatenispora rupis]